MPLQSEHITGLTHSRPLPPATVHKAAQDQVLLTDARRVGANRFLMTALWPDDHALYHPDAQGKGDPSFVVESVRQAAIHLSHGFYAIPRAERAFVLDQFGVEVLPPGLPHGHGRPLPVVLDISCSHTVARSGRADMSLEADVLIGGTLYARAAVRWVVMPSRQYDVLRRRNSPTPTAGSRRLGSMPTVPLGPEAVGRRLTRDVLLADAPDLAPLSWLLTMDQTHPVLFDHRSDHIPGMVLFEAMRQAAHVAGGGGTGGPQRVDAQFECFGELDVPVLITAEATGDGPGAGSLVLAAQQGDRTLARVRVARSAYAEAVPC
ncbi:lactone biosynthesis protein, mmfl [Streptomyces sp. SID2955]|nr:lactone biosynthesis protein, mmfl [Streptomyces sp. SID2955]